MIFKSLRRPFSLYACIFILTCFAAASVKPAQAQTNDEEELFLVTQKAFEDGFYDVAIRYVNQLFDQYPQTSKRIPAKLLLGQCYFFKNQYLKAYEIFNELLAYNEYRDATLFWLGETNLKGSDYQKAAEFYKQLLDLYPSSIYVPQAYYSLGWVYFESGQLDASRKQFKQLIEKFPDHQLTEDSHYKLAEVEYNYQNYENAIRYFKQYAIKYPQSNRMEQVYFYIGESNYYLGKYLPAIDNYQQAIDIAYDSKIAFMSKISVAWSYLKTQNYSLSQNYFEDAETYAKKHNLLTDDVYLGKATLFTEIEQYEQALEAYEELLRLFPNSERVYDALLGKANLQYTLDQYSEAIITYRKLILRLKTPNTLPDIYEKAHFGLAWAYLKSNQVQQSISTFEKIKNHAQNKTVKISALTQIGDAYQDINKLDKAIVIYDRILQQYPDNPFIDYVQYRQGIALLKKEDIEAAKLSFQSLKANFPQSKYIYETYYYLAIAHFKQENWQSAKRQIEQFINQPKSPTEFLAEAYQVSALCQFNLGEFKGAIEDFRYIIKNFPTQTTLINNAKLNIAKSYYKMNNTKEAIKRFTQIITKNPQSLAAQEAYLWLGDHYLEKREFKTADKFYQEFIDTYPGSAKYDLALFQLGQSFYAQEKYDTALEVLNKVSRKDPEIYVKANLAIAEIFNQTLTADKAKQTYENIITTSPDFQRDAFTKLANIYLKENDYKAALNAFTKALAAGEGFNEIKDAQIQFAIADVYEMMNNTQKAIEEYLKISYLYPDDVSWIIKAQLRIGRIFEDSDQWDKAFKIYTKVKTFNTTEAKFAQERINWIKNNIPDLNVSQQ